MVWDDHKDEVLCREVLLFEPYQFKPRSRERGNGWKAIAENLTACATLHFRVDARAVRERVGAIVKRHKQKNTDELKASGVSPEHTSLDDALEEITQKMVEAEKYHDETTQQNVQKNQQEAQKAEETRQLALETLGETSKRKSDDFENPTTAKKRPRSSGSETLVYLREKAAKDRDIKLGEMDLRRQELELRKQEVENTKQQQNLMFEHLQTQNNQLFLLLASKNQCEQTK